MHVGLAGWLVPLFFQVTALTSSVRGGEACTVVADDVRASVYAQIKREYLPHQEVPQPPLVVMFSGTQAMGKTKTANAKNNNIFNMLSIFTPCLTP